MPVEVEAVPPSGRAGIAGLPCPGFQNMAGTSRPSRSNRFGLPNRMARYSDLPDPFEADPATDGLGACLVDV